MTNGIKLVMVFPFDVKQVGGNVVEVNTKPYDGPVLSEGLLDVLAPDLSAAEQDRLADDVRTYIMSESIKRSIRVDVVSR